MKDEAWVEEGRLESKSHVEAASLHNSHIPPEPYQTASTLCICVHAQHHWGLGFDQRELSVIVDEH